MGAFLSSSLLTFTQIYIAVVIWILFESHLVQKGDLGKQPITEVAVKILVVYFLKIVIISRSSWERGGRYFIHQEISQERAKSNSPNPLISYETGQYIAKLSP